MAHFESVLQRDRTNPKKDEEQDWPVARSRI